MAPWSSWWSQSTQQPQPQQQQQQQQQQQPSIPIISNPPPNPTPVSPPKTTGSETKDDHYREMPEGAELRQIAAKSLQTGAVTGGIGLIVGAGLGIVRSAPPTLFALFAGLQWFALGSSYMASRELLYHAWGGEENLSSSDFVKAGGVAGGVSGMAGGMLRGPRNVLPGILFFGSLGAGSSYISQRRRGTESEPKRSWLDSKWSPMQRLSDKDYINKLEEKILRLDAEIAIIDESIESLKGSSQSPAKHTEPTTK
ncbi:hypothetical protein F4861DRAFT_538529 [Xylaria intraflava]|nr:hypothetical protein F4861DRAFT_538529 [Xylaria intraflava]